WPKATAPWTSAARSRRSCAHKKETTMTVMNGKVALITGAGSGIGLATAKAFAQAGASVVLADRHEDAVRAATGELIAAGRKALAARCDVTDDRQVASMIDQTVSP